MDVMLTGELLGGAAAGLLLSSLAACLPGLHVYNVLALVVLVAELLGRLADPTWLYAFFASAVTGYSLLNTIPSIVFSAPDESAMFTVMPGQRMLRRGAGFEAVAMSVCGGVWALVLVTLLLWAALETGVLVFFFDVIRPHYHWMIWCVICFVLLSEWPRHHGPVDPGVRRLARAWSSLAAGLFTFVASGLLGFVLFYGAVLPASSAYQSLLPAFLGLFAVPGLLLGMLSPAVAVPVSQKRRAVALQNRERRDDTLHGVLSGCAGGMFAAVLPAVTAGVGGLLAGHASGVRGDRSFLVAQGASRTSYYVGGLCLLMVPGLHMKRGGAAHMLRSIADPWEPAQLYTAILAALGCAAVCLVLWMPLFKLSMSTLRVFGRRQCSVFVMALVALLVLAMTGPAGLLVMVTATGLGLVPVLYGARRSNALGVVLLPVACGMSGVGAAVAKGLGLL